METTQVIASLRPSSLALLSFRFDNCSLLLALSLSPCGIPRLLVGSSCSRLSRVKLHERTSFAVRVPLSPIWITNISSWPSFYKSRSPFSTPLWDQHHVTIYPAPLPPPCRPRTRCNGRHVDGLPSACIDWSRALACSPNLLDRAPCFWPCGVHAGFARPPQAADRRLRLFR